ncbi:peptidylprolyl isomerase [Gracilimonas sp.]|uniref:peptidylprolyl isomerase n=1 Tax=Gracilimonas sp. TaxID=1974203 RepID=UPI0025C7122D|nr:peptidylprolyl isomerase [Gracilimonas sp.]
MYRLIALCTVFLMIISCARESAYSELLTEDYPELYTYVFERNADSLLAFTDHSNEYIRNQAWRGLISTPVESMDEFITRVQYADSEVAWVALSHQELTDEQLSRLQDLWEIRPSLRNGISLVLGRQGNQASLNFLVQNFETIMDSDYEYETALAISRLSIEHELNESNQKVLLRYAAILDDPELFRAYFYGLYRSNQALAGDDMRQTLWETYEWTQRPEIKQYAAKILFNTDAEWFFARLPIGDASQMNVQLAIELAQHTGKLNWSEKLENLYRRLLNHSNPAVNEVALSQIKNHPGKVAAFDEVIISEVVENEEKEASVRLSGILALSEVSGYLSLADTLAEESEYLLIKKLNIYQKGLAAEEYLETLEEYAVSENRMEGTFAVQALSGWWTNLSEARKSTSFRTRIRTLVFELLEQKDRSITYTTLNFLTASGLVEENDFERLEELLSDYRLPEDVEVFQAYGSLLKEHFEDRAAPVIDALVQKGNAALNSALHGQGWEIPDEEGKPQTFRTPNWQRLAELEYEPIWVLETEKGTIKIAMNVLIAPATIAGMDSLTQAGAYDGVAFHRVVPNFVIQGGDVESGLGTGGPGYVVPTEGSEKDYKRGMVGIASAGTDTEGSQYFIMHQWKPHLNGDYTIVGEVTEGMEVVDRILEGDKVTKAYWQQREE